MHVVVSQASCWQFFLQPRVLHSIAGWVLLLLLYVGEEPTPQKYFSQVT